MREDTEKALLRALAEAWHNDAFSGENPALDDAARAYLATLEPKPEPKRGVEEILRHVRVTATSADCERLDEALRLYREERERDERRWEQVGQAEFSVRHTCCGGCASVGWQGPCQHMAVIADRLRAAREGK